MTTEHDILGRPPMRRQVTDDADYDGPSIEDLCKPLSAKVMPKRAIYSLGGRIMDEREALSAQRRVVNATKVKP